MLMKQPVYINNNIIIIGVYLGADLSRLFTKEDHFLLLNIDKLL